MCRSRRELSNEYLLAKIGVDTAENEPLEVWGKIIQYYSFVSLLVPDEVVRHSRTAITSILEHRERNHDHVRILGVDCRTEDVAEIPGGGFMLQPTLSVEGNCFRKAPLKFLDGREFDTTNANALCLRSLHGERGRNSEIIFLRINSERGNVL